MLQEIKNLEFLIENLKIKYVLGINIYRIGHVMKSLKNKGLIKLGLLAGTDVNDFLIND